VSGEWHWFFADVNPEPWAIGDLSVGRRGAKYIPMVGRNHQLHAYKESIREAIPKDHGLWFKDPIQLQFYFYRAINIYETHQARTARSHEADVTNMQKATEDALQDVFFKNDKEVKVIASRIVAQGVDITPGVIIGIKQLEEHDAWQLPAGAQSAHDMYWMTQQAENDRADPNAWGAEQQ